MATAKDVRSLAPEERQYVIDGLDLLQKSALRASKAASNPVISMEHSKIAAQASNLIMHFKNHSFEV